MARIPALEPPFTPDVEAQLATMMPAGMPPIGLFRTFTKLADDHRDEPLGQVRTRPRPDPDTPRAGDRARSSCVRGPRLRPIMAAWRPWLWK